MKKEKSTESKKETGPSVSVSSYTVAQLKGAETFAKDRYLLDLLDSSKTYTKDEALNELDKLRKRRIGKEVG